jgi:FKBP-type peptidyl-prolyl cis-trans isomerase FkpA
MKRLFIFCSLVLLFVSCNKPSVNTGCQYTASTFVAPTSEITSLQNYITANHPAAIQHSSGLFYEINNPGSGITVPEVCSAVTVKYTGTLTNGTMFDQNTTGVSFTLGQLILGWQKGIPLIKKGGSINLYLPPSLGYGSAAVGSIPANSILVFTIQLLDVQ